MPTPDQSSISDLVRNALGSAPKRAARGFAASRGALRRMVGAAAGGIRPRLQQFDEAPELDEDPFNRLFGSEIGRMAAGIVGNETRTLDIVQTLSVDLMVEAVRNASARAGGSRFRLEDDMRQLFVPAHDGLPPTLLILDPELEPGTSRVITDEILVYPPMLAGSLHEEAARSEELEARQMLLSDPEHVQAALRIAQPEVVLARRPRMERLSAPSPLRCIETASEKSTAGIYCRDSAGVIGVTACFHGTGPVGTEVTVDGVPARVEQAHEIQDIVFIPLPAGIALNARSGVRSVLRDRTPSQYIGAEFEGLTSGKTATNIQSHDAGLLRNRASLQLKVQTGPETNKGDSGSALVDADGHIVGFAFEKSAFGEIPQITDWIWAANALGALGLEPVQ